MRVVEINRTREVTDKIKKNAKYECFFKAHGQIHTK